MTVLWKGDAEAPTAEQFTGMYNALCCAETPEENERHKRVNRDPRPKQGAWCYKATVMDGDECWQERSEVSQSLRGGEAKQFRVGMEVWEAFWVMLSGNFSINITTGHRTLYQHKQVGFDAGGGPPMTLNVFRGNYRITNQGPRTGANKHVDIVGPAVPRQWARFLIHTKFSLNASDGLIEVWSDAKNGPGGELEQVLSRRKPTVYVDDDGKTPTPIRVNMGLYRESESNPGTEWVAHDGLTVATTRDEAVAGANFGP